MLTPVDSLIVNRWIGRIPLPRPWVVAGIGAILVLIPIAIAYASGFAQFLGTTEAGRALFFSPLVIVYSLAIIHPLEKSRENVAQSLQPLVQIDEDTYALLIKRACRMNPTGQWIAFGVGVVFAVLDAGFFKADPDFFLLSVYTYVAHLVMLGTVAWTIYVVFNITRLTNTLVNQPLRFSIFDIRPFEPIGRQSLFLSLSFVGLIILGLLFTLVLSDLVDPRRYFALENIVVYSILVSAVILVFFLNMRSTHKVLARTKRQELELTGERLASAYHRMHELASVGQDISEVAREINAFAIGKEELKLTRTWPYNTEMLRTLFASILVPIAVALTRFLAQLFAN